MCVGVCACVCVCVHDSLSHPNASRLITRRESQSGSRRIQFLLSSAKNKGRSFTPPFLFISSSSFLFHFLSSLPPLSSPPRPLLTCWQPSMDIFTLLWSLAARTHTPLASQPPYCGKRGVNFVPACTCER